MEKIDLRFSTCYTENYQHKIVSEEYERPRSLLKISFKNSNLKKTYLIIINIDIIATVHYVEISVSTFTVFTFRYDNFIPQLFYSKELESMVELVSCAHNNARIMFHNEYKNIPGLKDFYIPFMFLSQIKEWMAATDVYNKL